jgi:hypothetical protein
MVEEDLRRVGLELDQAEDDVGIALAGSAQGRELIGGSPLDPDQAIASKAAGLSEPDHVAIKV